MSAPSPDPFRSSSRESPRTSSDLKQQMSLPLRTTRPAVGTSSGAVDSSPLSGQTTRQSPLSDTSDRGHVFQFGASKASATPHPAQSQDNDLDQSPTKFTFKATDHGNNKATSGSAASTIPSKSPSSERSPAPASNPWAIPQARVFGSDKIASQGFTFKYLHNTTPLPSRAPSPSPGSSPPDEGRYSPFSASFLSPSSSQSSVTVGRSPSQTPKSLRVPLLPSSPALSLTESPLGAGRQPAEGSVAQPDAARPYDLRDEETPQHRFFSPGFQSILQKGLSIAKDTVTAIEQLGDLVGDSVVTKHLETAKRLRVFHGSDTRTIAVLGDSGEGKSSLINSLLHFPGVAKTGDIGSACTSVVTEYRQKTTEHTAPITIEVEYLSASEIETVLKELVWSYRQLYLPGVESDETSAQDYARYQRESAQAWSALEAAFKHKKEFKQERLRDMSDGALERVTSQLVQWAQEIEWPEGGANGIWTSTAQTAEECCEKTELFMTDRYWPFTKIIRVYLNAQVLKTGVVLADLPGLQDTNLARVRATQDYLMRCNNIFIVAKISRAITDQSLKTSLFTVLSRHVPLEWEESAAKSLNVAVVCTKSEDIDLETSRREFCGDGKSVSPTTIKKLDKDIENAKRSGNSALKKKLKLDRELLFIEARNQHVKQGLQNAYASKVPDKKLEVFCVSNKLYGKYTRKGNGELVQASGIPALRKFCHSITADAQLREATHLVQTSLFSLLNSLYLWASSSLMEARDRPSVSKEMIDEKLKQTTTGWTKAIGELSQGFTSCFEQQVLDMQQHRQRAWQDAAASEGRQWHNWHWTQYNAWCLNNGNHSTPKRDHVDWNAKIIWKMRTELEFQWDLVQEEISVVFSDLLRKVKSLLEGVKATITVACPPDFHRSLVDGIDARIRHCEYAISLSEQDFSRDFKLTRRYASESNHNSFILRQMLPAYRDASNQFGTGKAARQRNIVQGRITDETLFANIYIAMSERMKVTVDAAERGLQGLLQQTMGEIREDVVLTLSGLPDDSRFAEQDEKLEQFLGRVSRLKDQAEIVGRMAAE